MAWFFATLVVLALGAIGFVASGRGAGLAPTYDDRADVAVPGDRELTGDDLRRVRFTTTVRGYRMSEVDELLSRLAGQVDASAQGRTDGGEPEF